jgi:hypothetical protein
VNLLIQVGLIELAIAALLGWAVVIRSEKPEWLHGIGIVQPRRILQMHLDYIMMGLIAIAVGVVLPDFPDIAAGLLVFGTFVNPILFLPMAFSNTVEKSPWFRFISVISFLAISIALVWAAVLGLGL